ncbi:multicopper oxidase domain-containing protein [Peribacillus sp. JNUCC 23]
MLLAPAERLDVIIDFSNLGGKMITLKNDAPTHFPIGDPVDPDSTGIIMQFRVTKLLSNIDTSVIPAFMGSIEWPAEYTASNHRYLQLSKEKDQYGRPLFLLDQKKWDDPITEHPHVGSTEIWNFINTDGGDHPIHLHLVQFQLLDRCSFDVDYYKQTKKIKYTSRPIPPHSATELTFVARQLT